MKTRLTLLILLALLLLVGVGYAADSLAIPRHLMGGGGGTSQGVQFAVHASIGQAVTGQVVSAPYRLASGFWPGGWPSYSVHLPFIRRSAP